MRRWLELLYIPTFFLLHASVFLGISSAYAIVLIATSAIISAVLFLKREQNSRMVEALIIAGLFYSSLIPPWSGMLFMLMLMAMPKSFINHSRVSFAFRCLVFPSLAFAFLSGFNAFGLAVLVYLISLMAISILEKAEVKTFVHKEGED